MQNKKIIVGVTGGIAAYKTAELVRLLVKAGFSTHVAMTENATRFVAPLTFEALTGNRVICDMWSSDSFSMDHIFWGQGSELVVIAPATANFIAKMAHGIGDDFLSTLMLATTAKVLVCPSMNTQMFLNPAVKTNIRLLEERGFVIMEPKEGELACRTEGPGRLPEPVDIFEAATGLLSKKDLSGLTMLVTAGATVEPIDPVRFISNRSSGKMGYAIAKAAKRRGAEVTLVSGPVNLSPPAGVMVIKIRTAEEMRKAVLANHQGCNVIIKAAAVSDYRPVASMDQKIKKANGLKSIELVENPDILAELGRIKGGSSCILVGFAAETKDLLINATEKLKQKNLDLIVANDVSRADAGFETDTNQVKMLYRDGHTEDLPLMTKDEVADHLLDRIKELWQGAS